MCLSYGLPASARAEECKRSFSKLRRSVKEYWPMPAVWHDPESGARDSAIHIHCHLNRIERVAVAIDDQGCGSDCGQSKRCEVHVVPAVLHPASPIPKSGNLLVPMFVTFAHCFPFLRRLAGSGRDLRHDRPGLIGKMHGGAHENHGFNPLRLQGRHVEKNVPTHAESDRPAFADAKMIQQCEGIQRALPVGDRLLRVGGAAVTTRVRQDERVFARKLIASGMGPVFLAASATMKKQERLTRAFSFVIRFNAVEWDTCGLHSGHYGRGRAKKQSGKRA